MLIAAIVSVVVSILVVTVSTIFFTVSMVEYGTDYYQHSPYSNQDYFSNEFENIFPDL